MRMISFCEMNWLSTTKFTQQFLSAAEGDAYVCVPGGLWVTLWFLDLISPSATRRQIEGSNDRSSVVL